MRLTNYLSLFICSGLLIWDAVFAKLPRGDHISTAIRQSRRKRHREGKRLAEALTPPTLVCQEFRTINSGVWVARERGRKSSEVLSLLLPWLYFTAISVNIPNLPKFVNWSINGGNSNVSPESAAVYGTLSGVDAFFTFLVVNLVGCMSDSFGRRPFMLLSACGLGLAYTITLHAKTAKIFYIAAMIDGLTSCMFSQAQSYVTDMNNRSDSPTKENISVILGRFQGIAVGMAFLVGIPLGAILGLKHGVKATLKLAIALCCLNAALITLFLPEQPVSDAVTSTEAEITKHTTSTTSSDDVTNSSGDSAVSFSTKFRRVKWANANPVGAIRMLARKRKLVAGAAAYFFLNIAQVGVQINWINYLQFRFGWSASKSGSTLMVVGFSVALLPQLFIKTLGKINAISFGLLLHAASIIALGNARSEVAIYVAMAFFSAGACALPMLLGFLTDEVGSDEVGALQGAADTVRTVSSVLAAPLMSRVFAHCISPKSGAVARPEGALYASSVFSLVAYFFFQLGC